MEERKNTKHKGIYTRGSNYYVTYGDGSKKVSKTGEQYLVMREDLPPA